MSTNALLALEDGSVYQGYAFGAYGTTHGEVVFNTSMCGYQEMLTDPSYAGQILTLTYPLIGNYGINDADSESKQIQIRGLVIREQCLTPSSYRQGISDLDSFLKNSNIVGIASIDTRALTRNLRRTGVMMGIISTEISHEEAMDKIKCVPSYGDIDFVKEVSVRDTYQWQPAEKKALYHIVVIDYGLKYNILRLLAKLGCLCTVVPCTTGAEEILDSNPDGILLSPGPGDPSRLAFAEETIRKLIGKKPIMGICLGLQIIARAFGAETFKLKFGHRGGNHPVRDLGTGKIYITAQNHGYAVDANSLKGGLEISHINVNDGTVEGLLHHELRIMATQYHSEGSPGPYDNEYLFNNFLKMVKIEG